jgi:hypothetical protein
MNNEMRQVLPDKNEKQKTFQNVLGPNFPWWQQVLMIWFMSDLDTWLWVCDSDDVGIGSLGVVWFILNLQMLTWFVTLNTCYWCCMGFGFQNCFVVQFTSIPLAFRCFSFSVCFSVASTKCRLHLFTFAFLQAFLLFS